MTRVERAIRKQEATLWRFDGYDANGEPSVSTAETIYCRWEEDRRQVVDALGNPIAIDGQVWVDEAVAVGSLLRLGSTGTTYMEIVATSTIPDIKGRDSELTLLVRRFRGTLPS